MEASAFVSLIARYDGLQIKAPFGELIFAYAPGTAVTEDATGRIQLAVDGTTLSLLIADPLERKALLAFLREKSSESRGP
jgi:hypothetical protein